VTSAVGGPASLDVAGGARAGGRRRSSPALGLALVVWDTALPVALVMIAYGLDSAPTAPWSGSSGSGWLALMLGLLSPLGLAVAGGYRHRRRRTESRFFFAMRLLALAIVLSWISVVVAVLAGWPVGRAEVLVLPVGLWAGWLLGRWACDRHPAASRDRALLVGSGAVAQRILALTDRHRERRLHVVGRLDDEPLPMEEGAPPLLGGLADLSAVLVQKGIDRVIVAFPRGRDEELLDVLRGCSSVGVQVDVVPRFFDLVGPSPRAYSLGGMPLVEVPSRGLTPSQRFVKRAVDVAGSLFLIAVLLPLTLVIAAAIAAGDGRPVLFRQTRVGQAGRAFRIVKFRTMRPEADEAGVARTAALADQGQGGLHGEGSIAAVVRDLKADDGTRLTPLGRFLRRTSLDELPQLVNVLIGDMSLVGPRPLRPFEVGHLGEWQRARQELRPGLTGLWQVLGRSSIGWDERMQLDYTYVAHWSLLFDLGILARTVPAVLKRHGAR